MSLKGSDHAWHYNMLNYVIKRIRPCMALQHGRPGHSNNQTIHDIITCQIMSLKGSDHVWHYNMLDYVIERIRSCMAL